MPNQQIMFISIINWRIRHTTGKNRRFSNFSRHEFGFPDNSSLIHVNNLCSTVFHNQFSRLKLESDRGDFTDHGTWVTSRLRDYFAFIGVLLGSEFRFTKICVWFVSRSVCRGIIFFWFSITSPERFYADRIAGGDRHYCRSDCSVVASRSTGSRSRSTDPVQEQPETTWLGTAQLRKHLQPVSNACHLVG